MFKAPPIPKDLLDYLDQVYSPRPPKTTDETHPYHIAAQVHRARGAMDVISHLRALYEEQQNEDPLNVHEGT